MVLDLLNNKKKKKKEECEIVIFTSCSVYVNCAIIAMLYTHFV